VLTVLTISILVALVRKHLTRQGKIALRSGRANARLCLRR
jgi:hypothetical protein